MKDHDVFWKLEALSDQRLLERLGSMLGSSRRLMAELIAHLGEVEERRLHLVAACSSMFTYCLKLGMTEDEAYRRIEVARLARRYPAIFRLLAEGQLSISVVALLKHYLSDENHLDLLASVAGKTVGQTRALIAARFPRPDVPCSVRKLPERRTTTQPSFALSTPTEPSASGATGTTGETRPDDADGAAPHTDGTVPRFAADVTVPLMGRTVPRFTSNVTSSTEVPPSPVPADIAGAGGSMSFAPAVNVTCATGTKKPPPTHSQRVAPQRPSSRIEPLAAQRYKVQLTASAELARKLELARDLMRHCNPGGELGPIVERALDLLIESLMLRRFGKKARPKRTSACARNADPEPQRARHADPEPRSDFMSDTSRMRDTAGSRTSTQATAEPDSTTLAEPESTNPAEPDSTTLDPTTPDSTTPDSTTPAEPDSTPAEPASTTPTTTAPDSADVQGDPRAELERSSVTSYIPRSTRRAVVERDGLGCSWMDEHGGRCGSRAWLEYDHHRPRAKGGGSKLDNLRLLCRHHNRFAAEREYGRRHIEHATAERRATSDERRATSDERRATANASDERGPRDMTDRPGATTSDGERERRAGPAI